MLVIDADAHVEESQAMFDRLDKEYYGPPAAAGAVRRRYGFRKIQRRMAHRGGNLSQAGRQRRDDFSHAHAYGSGFVEAGDASAPRR